jgi:hypothetical protein
MSSRRETETVQEFRVQRFRVNSESVNHEEILRIDED